MPPKKSNRRNFISSILAAGTATGLALPIIAKSKTKNGDKIKMLTPDGKLVEVDRSVIEKAAGAKKATGKEVFEWMDKKHKS